MADKVPPPPPKPPQRPPKNTPGKPPMPPPKPPQPPSKPPQPPSKAPSPPKPPQPSRKTPPKKKAPPKSKPKGKPKGKPAAKKKRRGRKINIKLGLRQKKIIDEKDTYTDQIGWTSTTAESFEELEDPTPKEPEIVTHQCSMCGSTMRIPRPKRERYKVICAYPECGHSDTIGI
jgi:hypothetical protein|tara:strand:+ start:7141 stop:7662 length:522 start_codon:yes stop_codon:yes gene_type:complete